MNLSGCESSEQGFLMPKKLYTAPTFCYPGIVFAKEKEFVPFWSYLT